MAIQRFNAVGGYSTGITGTDVIDSIGNITGVGATFSGLIRANAGISASGITVGRIVSGGTSGLLLQPGSGVLSVGGGISASGGFTFGNPSGTTYISYVSKSSCENGGLWIPNGSLQLGGSAMGSGAPFYYSPCGEQFIVYGYSTFQNSYNYQSGRSPLRLNGAPTQSVPIFAAYKQTVEGTQLTNTFTTTNMVAGIDQNGALFSTVGVCASGGTFANDIVVNSMTIGRGKANLASNIAIGASAYFSGTTGVNNVAIGLNALRLNQAGDVNTAIGAGALQSNVNGRNNVALGWNALNTLNTATWSALSQAEYNVAIGGNALGAATIGSYNIAIGAAAAQALTTSNSNIAIGTYTLLRCGAGGGDNTTIGHQSMVGSGAATTQTYNTSIGANSMFNIAAANYNTAVGHSALFTSTTGQYNTIIGAHALYYATTPSASVAIGYEAGKYAGITGGSNLTSSTNSVYIGGGSKSGFTTSSNEIVIGSNAVGLGSNTTVIGTTSTTATTIHGSLTTGPIYTDSIYDINGTLNINNKANTRVAIGDYDHNLNSTYIYLRDNISEISISNPFGVIYLGDPGSVDNGNYISYDAANATFSGNGTSTLDGFQTISADATILENNRRVTTNARSWFL